MVTEFQKLIYLPEALVYVFGQLPLAYKIAFPCSIIMILSWFYGLLISPLICKFYIVPGIEKKIGHKLGANTLLKSSPLSPYLNRDIEISTYILNRYYAFKKRNERGVPFGAVYDKFSLKHAGYTIDMVSKPELIFSFLVKINLLAGGISMLIIFVIAPFCKPLGP